MGALAVVGEPLWAGSAGAEPATEAARAVAAVPLEGLFGDCVQHQKPGSQPEYTREARSAQVRGRVLAKLRFDAADQPPSVELFHRPSVTMLREPVLDWLQGLRRPCHAGDSRSMRVTFAFGFVGERAGFSTFKFENLLALARDRRPIDTTGTRCPLTVRWRYLQPYLPNSVTVDGPPDPAQAPIVARLAAMELALTRQAADAAWGDAATFEIPCSNPDSKPKE